MRAPHTLKGDENGGLKVGARLKARDSSAGLSKFTAPREPATMPHS